MYTAQKKKLFRRSNFLQFHPSRSETRSWIAQNKKRKGKQKTKEIYTKEKLESQNKTTKVT